MIKLIGTTHLVPKEEIEKIIKEENPDVIGVELCQTRYNIFTNQVKQEKGKDDSLIGKITEETRKKAEEQNLDYGSDQKSAMFYAINNNIPLLLVDKDIVEIKQEMTQIPIEEQTYLQKELLKFQEESLQKEVNEVEVIERMKKDIPITYKVLVEGRNNFIISKIKKAKEEHPNKKILIFLGKGHIKEIERGIK